MKKTITSLGCILAVSACATATPPSFTASDVDKFTTDLSYVDGLGNASSMPTSGSASYSGLIGASISGEPGSLIGNINLNANFTASGGTVVGQIANMNILDFDGIDDQEMGGSVSLSGTITGTTLEATGQDTFTAVAEGTNVKLVSDVTINGQFKDDKATADAIVGGMSIDGTIVLPFGQGEEDFSATTGGTDFYLLRD